MSNVGGTICALTRPYGELWLLEECPHHPSANHNLQHKQVVAQVMPQVVAPP